LFLNDSDGFGVRAQRNFFGVLLEILNIYACKLRRLHHLFVIVPSRCGTSLIAFQMMRSIPV
jgi:hypothetical protein